MRVETERTYIQAEDEGGDRIVTLVCPDLQNADWAVICEHARTAAGARSRTHQDIHKRIAAVLLQLK